MSSYPAPNPPPPPLGIYNESNWYSKSDPTGPVGPQGVQGGLGPVGVQGFQGRQGLQGGGGAGTQGAQGFQGLGLQGAQGVQGTAGGGGGGDTIIISSAVNAVVAVFNDGGQKLLRTFSPLPALLTNGDYFDLLDNGYFYKVGGTNSMNIQYFIRYTDDLVFERYFMKTQFVNLTGITTANTFQVPYQARLRFTRTSSSSFSISGAFVCGGVALDTTLTGVFDPNCSVSSTNGVSLNITGVNPANTTSNVQFITREDNATVDGNHRMTSLSTQTTAFIQ